MNLRIVRFVFLIVSSWFMLPSALSVAQSNSGAERPDDLAFTVSPVRKKYVGVATPSRGSADPVERQVSRTQQAAEDMMNAARGSDIAGLNVYAQNLGGKAVTSIRGELLIIVDNQEAASIQFASKGKLSAGKVRRLAKINIGKLKQPLRDRFLTDLEYGRAVARVRVERVEYEDGSFWRRP